MQTTIYKLVAVVNVIALAVLLAVWWVNGRDDTWFYIACAAIVVSSFLYARPAKNDSAQ